MTGIAPMAHATLDDLYKVEGRAELIGGRIVRFTAQGYKPNRLSARIARSLDEFAVRTGVGEAHAGGLGYAICELPSGRESFQPHASYYDGPLPANPMRFVEGPPKFAAEVRSENDYGPAAEAEMADKRADYFAAGTLAVWDVDPLARTVAVYRNGDALQPAAVFGPGDIADAEPAVPGWRLAVDTLFAGL
jgi:Uma2 family endonuclease